ncbi:MAG: hypothetical protein QM820_29425 [Minicystis sp.]
MSNHLPSATTHLFLDSTEQLALRLEQEPSEVAHALAREARALYARFASWQNERPADDVRVATIQALFDLNRRAMDYLSG